MEDNGLEKRLRMAEQKLAQVEEWNRGRELMFTQFCRQNVEEHRTMQKQLAHQNDHLDRLERSAMKNNVVLGIIVFVSVGLVQLIVGGIVDRLIGGG